jgi:hypothetical protein
VTEREDAVQRRILSTWDAINNGLQTPYEVLSTSRQARNYTRGGGAGVTQGVPDLLFAHPAWGGILVGQEVKTHDRTSKPSEAQARLAEMGVYAIVRDELQSVGALAMWEYHHRPEGWLGRYEHLIQWLRANGGPVVREVRHHG